ncbi:MAG: hypothetical protein ACJAS3_000150 [Roseivirga sp.]|jgi:hypothetical protein
MWCQTLDINITRGADLNFTFNTIRQYNNGIILAGATEFRIESSSQWDLYVGTQTNTAGQWDVLTSYSSAGTTIVPVSTLEIRATSPGGTSQQTSFFQLQDNSSPIFLIGTAADDPLTNNGIGANLPGDGTNNAFTHRFRIDYRLTPTMNYTPGVYSLTVVFTLAEDL